MSLFEGLLRMAAALLAEAVTAPPAPKKRQMAALHHFGRPTRAK